jgi:hypothetical protein
MFRDERSSQRVLAAAVVILLCGSVGQAGAEPLLLYVLGRATPPGMPALVGQAVERAVKKLAVESCREVFDDYRDAEGRTLRENLQTAGQTEAGYLQWTLFYDGSGTRSCEQRSTYAWTKPNSHVVFVCTEQFRAVAARDPELAAVLIIHEELHSLGLGENPPDSKEITARVISGCGR